jgi:alpha-beta hydrolase superfamily lysophospholipase
MKPLDVASIDGLMLDAVLHPAVGSSRGAVVQAHGIAADMDEGGMYVRLADRLAEVGFDVVRFSFRGHGRSQGSQRGATIAGEMLDLQAVVDLVEREHSERLSIVAASFGAVATSLSLPYLAGKLHGLVFWNPVLDLRRTFVEPTLPWGVENFGPDQQVRLADDGYFLIDGEFQFGRVMFEELKVYRPLESFLTSDVPALVLHGDRDTYVPYDVAKDACASRRDCEFHAVEGSDHGFDSREREDEAIAVTVDWLRRLYSDDA